MKLTPEERAELSARTKLLNNCGAVEAATNREDWGWLTGWIHGRWEVAVTAAWVAAVWSKNYCYRDGVSAHWSDASWAMFWKVKLIEAGLFDPGPGSGTFLGRLETVLHMGFLSVEETEEHLARLDSNEKWDAIDGCRETTLATPGIERTLNNPEPIDRTAAKVVGLN